MEPRSVVCILKPGEDPAQLSSCRPINQLGTVGKRFDYSHLIWALRKVKCHGLMGDKECVSIQTR